MVISKVNISTTTLNYLNCGLKEFIHNFYNIYRPTCNFHHTIIDQGSTDGSVEWLRSIQKQYGFDIVSFNENKGVSWAHNYVWRNYPGEHYLKLDPDVIIEDQGWLPAMIKIAEENPKVVGNIGVNFESHYKNTTLSGMTLENKVEGNIGGACLFVPNYINKELGYWNVLPELYGEEDALMGIRVHMAKRMCLYLTGIKCRLICNETKEYIDFKKECRQRNIYDKNSEYQKIQKAYHAGTMKLYVP